MAYPYKTLREEIGDEEKLGNVVRVKTPIKCGDYANLVDIGNGVPGKQPETEMRALVRYLHSLPGKPIGIVENPVNNRPDIPVVVNLWPGRERTLRGMGLKDKDTLSRKIEDILATRIRPRVVPNGKALCKQVIIPEEKVDLRKDIPRCWVEFVQWSWTGANGTMIVRDPETGSHGLSKERGGPFDWKEADPDNPYPVEWVKRYMIASMSARHGSISSNTGVYYVDNFRAKNTPMPCAFAFDLPTDVHIVAALKSLHWPRTGDEYELLGGFRGEPVEVVESETIPGLLVPADAEWIIEGEVLPEPETVPHYAMDVYRGNLHGGESMPVFRTKCITHRKNAWWSAASFSSSGLNGHDGNHIGLYTVPNEVAWLTHLRRCGFKVKDVAATTSDAMTVVIQTELDGKDKPYPHYGKKVAMALASAAELRLWAKYIIVVGPDINPYDLADVLWAVGTRTMPVSDSVVTGTASATWGDPRPLHPEDMQSVNILYGQQVLIDALIKVPERYDGWPPRSEPAAWERAAIKRMQEKVAQT